MDEPQDASPKNPSENDGASRSLRTQHQPSEIASTPHHQFLRHQQQQLPCSSPLQQEPRLGQEDSPAPVARMYGSCMDSFGPPGPLLYSPANFGHDAPAYPLMTSAVEFTRLITQPALGSRADHRQYIYSPLPWAPGGLPPRIACVPRELAAAADPEPSACSAAPANHQCEDGHRKDLHDCEDVPRQEYRNGEKDQLQECYQCFQREMEHQEYGYHEIEHQEENCHHEVEHQEENCHHEIEHQEESYHHEVEHREEYVDEPAETLPEEPAPTPTSHDTLAESRLPCDCDDDDSPLAGRASDAEANSALDGAQRAHQELQNALDYLTDPSSICDIPDLSSPNHTQIHPRHMTILHPHPSRPGTHRVGDDASTNKGTPTEQRPKPKRKRSSEGRKESKRRRGRSSPPTVSGDETRQTTKGQCSPPSIFIPTIDTQDSQYSSHVSVAKQATGVRTRQAPRKAPRKAPRQAPRKAPSKPPIGSEPDQSTTSDVKACAHENKNSHKKKARSARKDIVCADETQFEPTPGRLRSETARISRNQIQRERADSLIKTPVDEVYSVAIPEALKDKQAPSGPEDLHSLIAFETSSYNNDPRRKTELEATHRDIDKRNARLRASIKRRNTLHECVSQGRQQPKRNVESLFARHAEGGEKPRDGVPPQSRRKIISISTAHTENCEPPYPTPAMSEGHAAEAHHGDGDADAKSAWYHSLLASDCDADSMPSPLPVSPLSVSFSTNMHRRGSTDAGEESSEEIQKMPFIPLEATWLSKKFQAATSAYDTDLGNGHSDVYNTKSESEALQGDAADLNGQAGRMEGAPLVNVTDVDSTVNRGTALVESCQPINVTAIPLTVAILNSAAEKDATLPADVTDTDPDAEGETDEEIDVQTTSGTLCNMPSAFRLSDAHEATASQANNAAGDLTLLAFESDAVSSPGENAAVYAEVALTAGTQGDEEEDPDAEGETDDEGEDPDAEGETDDEGLAWSISRLPVRRAK